MAGGVPAALDLFADAAGCKREGGEQQIEQRGFADAGGAGKCGDLAGEICREKGAQRPDFLRVDTHVRAARVLAEPAQRKRGKPALPVQRGDARAAVGVEVAFGDDEDRQDAAVHADGAELVQRGKHRRGLCRGGGDEQNVEVCHRRADEQVLPLSDGFDIGVAVFLDAQRHVVAHLGRYLLVAERAARPRGNAHAVRAEDGVFAADALDDLSVLFIHISGSDPRASRQSRWWSVPVRSIRSARLSRRLPARSRQVRDPWK